MSRRMSVSMTLDAVRSRQKTVTRRHVDTWCNLKPGDRLTLIEKGMGLPKGAKQVVVAEVEIVDVVVEHILAIDGDDIYSEGFDPREWPRLEWAAWWARSHGHRVPDPPHVADFAGVLCRRIAWRYIDEADGQLELVAP